MKSSDPFSHSEFGSLVTDMKSSDPILQSEFGSLSFLDIPSAAEIAAGYPNPLIAMPLNSVSSLARL